MAIAPPLNFTLGRLNSALLMGSENQLLAALKDVDLNELLSQETIAEVRSRGKSAMVRFLCTLAVTNEVDPEPAQVWLDCYQTIALKEESGHLSQLSKRNILRTATAAVAHAHTLSTEQLKDCKGSTAHWLAALELLFDFRHWQSAAALLEALQRQNTEATCWSSASKRLSDRHKLLIDETGIANSNIDYTLLARLYKLCEAGAQRSKVPELSAPLKRLEAHAQETAGAYDLAIATLKGTPSSDKNIDVLLEISRNQCKKGDLAASIQTLDMAIMQFESAPASPLPDQNVNAIDDQLGLPPSTTGQFNIAAASRALADLNRIFSAQGIESFLVSGTLLGYEREGKLLDHDKDIDIGIVGWEKQFDLCVALQQDGLFSIPYQFIKGQDTHYMPINHKPTGMVIDIFIYHPINGQLVTGVDFFFGYRQQFAFTPFELKKVRFLDVDMHVPQDTDLNLRENFGNWRVSDPSYISHLESPSTVDKGGLAYMLTARSNALMALTKKNPAKLRKIVHLMTEYAAHPCGMPQAVREKLTLLADRLDPKSHAACTTVTPEEEFQHA